MLDHRSNRRYDKDVVKKRAADLAAHYLGAGKREGGSRLLWRCPACEKGGKLSLRLEDNFFGCFNSGCELGGKADIITFIAYMENLHPKVDFLDVLEKAYDVLGLETERRTTGRVSGESKSTPAAPSTTASPKSSTPPTKEREEIFELCDSVFSRVMEISRLEGRDRKYLRKRGLSYETISEGRFGSMSHGRARYLKQVLGEEFGEDEMLRVPGFFRDSRTGKLGFTLTGEYLLIPYLDGKGRIANIEGRRVGDVEKGMGRYVSLRNSGNHLYMFPSYASEPERVEAFTEGCFGAVIAAQSGIAVGSIQGCKRFKATSSSSSPFASRGEDDDSLHELSGVSFRGRSIPYIPDADDPPNEDVLNAAPEAAHHLISRQGGYATLCSLPRGLDLDDWLLSMPIEERRRSFADLLADAVPLERMEEWKRSQHRTKTRKKQSKRRRIEKLPEEKESGEEPNMSSADAAENEEGEMPDAGENSAEEEAGGRSSDEVPALRHEVYSTLLEKAPLKDGHKIALAKLGVLEKAMSVGMLGSLSADEAGWIVSDLERQFGSEKLLTVPGFETNASGKVKLHVPVQSECVLLPCLDGGAFITAIEMVSVDAGRDEIPEPDMVAPLLGSEERLYVFAAYCPEEIEGFCQSPVAAILAAQSNVVLAAVRHDISSEPEGNASENTDHVVAAFPELENVDFGGREIPCALEPDATRAATYRHIKLHNGEPKSVSALAGGDERFSLLDYILATSEESRHEKLREMFPESPAHSRREAGEDRWNYEFRLSSVLGAASTASVALIVGVAAHTLLGRLEAFGQYVGVGYGGQPLVEGGLVGVLRSVANAAPLEALYAHSLLVSALCGLLAAVVGDSWRRASLDLRKRRESLARFRDSEKWRAHRIEEEHPSKSFVRPAELLEVGVAGVAVYFALRLLLGLLAEFQDVFRLVGVEMGTADVVLGEPGRAALYGAVGFGLLVLWRRVSARRMRLRIARGEV